MPQKLPKDCQQLMERGTNALHGVLDGSISPEEGSAIADLLSVALRLAKIEMEVKAAATEKPGG